LNQERPPIILPFAIIIALLAVSTASIFIRFAQRDTPSLVIAALRLTFASLMLAPIAFIRYRTEIRALSQRDRVLGIFSGVFLAVHFATWITSLEYTTVASSVVLVSTGPLWVALLSPFFLKEPLTKFVLIGMLLALIGGTVIGLSNSCQIDQGFTCPPLNEFIQGEAFIGNFLALAGAWAVAGYLMIGRRLRAKMSLIPYIFVVYGVAAVILLIIMFAAGYTIFNWTPMSYMWIILLALVPQLIGHSTYNWALAYLPAVLVSIVTLGEPIGSAVLAYFILDEAPTLLTVFGGILILTGIFFASRKTRRG
jgi:drug/metabolite transporter (DMT)-like permease